MEVEAAGVMVIGAVANVDALEVEKAEPEVVPEKVAALALRFLGFWEPDGRGMMRLS